MGKKKRTQNVQKVRRKQEAQEVMRGAPPLPMPYETGARLVQEAARISGRPAAELTLDEAVKILGTSDCVLEDETLDNLASGIALKMWESATAGMTDAQKQRFSDTLQNEGDAQLTLYAMGGAIGQAMHDAKITGEDASETVKNITEQAAENLVDMSGGGDEEKIAARERARSLAEAIAQVEEYINSPEYKALREGVETVTHYIEEHKDIEAPEELKSLAPFILREIEAHNETHGEKLTLDGALAEIGTSYKESPSDSPYREIIERARQRAAEYRRDREEVEHVEALREEIPHILAHPTDSLDYPVDKPNNTIWGLIKGRQMEGQLSLDIRTAGDGSTAAVMYSIDFDGISDLSISKTLTAFDKRVYVAAAALFSAGNEVFSASQIYAQMGNTGRPGADSVKKINDALTKMGGARITIDNIKELDAHLKYEKYKYDGVLLPFERITAYIDNIPCESAIHLLREPPFISFARGRKQLSRVPLAVLQSPISKSEGNLLIDDYLLERICQMKNRKRNTATRILYSTLYENCGIREKKQKQRAPEKIRKYLDHYKTTGFIRGYREDKDGIDIDL